MCRYAFTSYKTHFVCLPCRRSFKHDYGSSPRCPSCTKPMIHMGRDFHPPRRADRRQWAKLALLLDAQPERRDVVGPLPQAPLFDSCGCTGPGTRPRTLADAKSALRSRRSDRRAPAAKPRTRIGRSLRYS